MGSRVIASTTGSDVSTVDKPSAAEQEYLSRCLSLAVHEFRTPVSVTIGYLRFLLDATYSPLNEKQREWVERALQSCSWTNELVDEMSDFMHSE